MAQQIRDGLERSAALNESAGERMAQDVSTGHTGREAASIGGVTDCGAYRVGSRRLIVRWAVAQKQCPAWTSTSAFTQIGGQGASSRYGQW